MFRKMLRFCWSPILPHTLNKALVAMPQLVRLFVKAGIIQEQDYDKLNLFMEGPSLGHRRGQDLWGLRRQRAVNLLHPQVLNTWPCKGHKRTKNDLDDPECDTEVEDASAVAKTPPRKRSKPSTEGQKLLKNLRATGSSLWSLTKNVLNWGM